MTELDTDVCQVFKANLADYSLLEIVHHVVGNQLAAIMGYTYRLQRATLTSEQQAEAQHCEKWRDYLQIIEQKEVQLNDFLMHIRGFTSQPAEARFCPTLLKVDLASLVRKVVDQLLPLFPDKEVQIRIPEQQCLLKCDPHWIEIVVEHVFSHNLALHDSSQPATISLVCHDNPAYHLHEVQISLCTTKRPVRRMPVTEKVFDNWSQTLDQRDQDVCIALCYEILDKHGGRLWTEQEQRRLTTTAIALPLASGTSVNEYHMT